MATKPTVPRRRRTARRSVVDVYRSDYVQDSGTPLQWLIAWETVAARERAEREVAALLVFIAWLLFTFTPQAGGR